MLNKLLTFVIRAGVIFGVGMIVGGLILNDIFGMTGDLSLIVASIIWVIGGIYSLLKFNTAYSFIFLKNAEQKITEIIDHKNKQKIENEMLRIKQLLDNDILTENEYNCKMKILKGKYLKK
jgi:hypothetical protein